MKRNSGGAWWLRRESVNSKRATLRKYQGNQCCWCGKQMQQQNPNKWDFETIEHLIPRSKGGSNGIDNLALAHKLCNAKRGTEDREPLVRRVARNEAT